MRRIFTFAALLPSAAMAHSGDHSGVAALTHALTSTDHLAVLIAVAVVAGLAAMIWVRR